MTAPPARRQAHRLTPDLMPPAPDAIGAAGSANGAALISSLADAPSWLQPQIASAMDEDGALSSPLFRFSSDGKLMADLLGEPKCAPVCCRLLRSAQGRQGLVHETVPAVSLHEYRSADVRQLQPTCWHG